MTSRSESDVAKLLQIMEEQDGLLKHRICGFSPWRLIRFPVSMALQNLPLNEAKLPKVYLIIAFLRSCFDIFMIPRDCVYAVKSFTSALRRRSLIGYEDIYFEQILQNCPGGMRLFSYNAAGYDVRIPSWKGPQINVTAILVVSALLARLLPIRDDDHVFDKISKTLAKYLPPSYFPSKRIRRIFSSFIWQSHIYSWLLNRAGVHVIFVADTGERSLLKAARQNGCKFIELQHGIYTTDHPDALPAYSYTDANDEGLLLPDIIGTYGVYWSSMHQNTILGRAGRISAIGSSIIDSMRSVRNQKEDDDLMNLLVTTQGVAKQELIGILNEFLRECKVQFVLNIKLHPAYDTSTKAYWDALGRDRRVHVIAGHEEPDTYSLLAKSDLHISISSACHYDAIGLRIPTVIINLPSYEVVIDLANSGLAHVVSNGKELSNYISNKDWTNIPQSISEKYYIRGVVNNLAKWIPAI